jgi:hypothetical protein
MVCFSGRVRARVSFSGRVMSRIRVMVVFRVGLWLRPCLKIGSGLAIRLLLWLWLRLGLC